MKYTLYTMVKVPRPGRVKTRLGRDIGHIRATWWFRWQVAGLLRRLRDPRWQVFLAVTPDAEGLTSGIWPQDLPRVAQGQGNLGTRMARVFRAAPPGPACIIGADIPGITRTHIARAFKELGEAEAVFGPSPDGGYWLVGLRHPHRLRANALDRIAWGTDTSLADTMDCLHPRTIRLIDTLRDVDTVLDL
ncbi:MAG: glycosyltransferase [Rhodobacteraceae bacterium]|nr:glycosyltransferase [Paracoccaceae bacterium]